MIEILSFYEAKKREGEFKYVISINDHLLYPIFRVYGTKSNCNLNFNDIWEKNGTYWIWAGDRATPCPDKEVFLPEENQLDLVDSFLMVYPDFLESKSLIHCWAGISRSSSIYLYILLKSGYHFDDAMKKILEVRPFARPNLTLASYMKDKLNLNYDVRELLLNRFDYSLLT